jgi:hypothetical protein
VAAVGEVSAKNFFRRVYSLDRPRGGVKEFSIATFFVAYIGWIGHVEAVGDIFGATFLSLI